MHLSDVFKYIHSFGQKGHQIGRKIGDAVELLVYGMINENAELTRHLVVERGLEGATSAEHKVEFAFYKLKEDNSPSKNIDDLFGFIECKKVGVEVTVKQSFKKWSGSNKNKFYNTDGYSFVINPGEGSHKRGIAIKDVSTDGKTLLSVLVSALDKKTGSSTVIRNDSIEITEGESILFALDTNFDFHIVEGEGKLFDIAGSLSTCVICKIEKLEDGRISSISANECLMGPQTPEKAKQASFVSLDVRKRVLGRFDKTPGDDRLISILVLAEASHWDRKSRAMIRLCNDFNLLVPDEVLISFFREFENKFGEGYQNLITKNHFKSDPRVSDLVKSIIQHFNYKLLQDMDSNVFYRPAIKTVDGTPRLCMEAV